MDQIILDGLEFWGCHGITAEEKSQPQPFEVELVLGRDLSRAGRTDSIDDTVDYSRVFADICFIVEKESFNLLERLAARIAEHVLGYDKVIMARVTVKKLKPPIAGKYRSFGVSIERKRVACTAYLGLGTNLGDREKNLTEAVGFLEKLTSTQVLKYSSQHYTAPWGKINQPEFLNQVAAVETFLTPQELLQELLDIETMMGRQRLEKWGPRIIDIDLLLYGNQIIQEPNLIIPHPYLTQREFVLIPLLEIEPDLRLPDGRCLKDF
ncbi:MAG: 2-amino-4-hydroxy-6-hydroxymethyldihydropteridine diphosphokinase [Syntrophomonadaceae bacterium]|nr:2-amino-4-hydroxy-6-hydroxymethyldihydropteridine diphosphokinase [Syntrophomonadaceae bacterium]